MMAIHANSAVFTDDSKGLADAYPLLTRRKSWNAENVESA
jgi:hypothetical protein